MVEELPNSYIGLWHDHNNKIFWEKLVNKPIKWAKYHSIIMDNNNFQEKLNLYKTIKYSKLKKIIICNRLLIKSKILLNIDYLIEIPFNNWFDFYFDNLMLLIMNTINNEGSPQHNNNEPYIIIFCCGMGAKVLICELSKRYPNFIYLDFGSALDKICTKHTTRGWEPSYDEFIVSIRELLPNNWNDEHFDYIYDESKSKLGQHLKI